MRPKKIVTPGTDTHGELETAAVEPCVVVPQESKDPTSPRMPLPECAEEELENETHEHVTPLEDVACRMKFCPNCGHEIVGGGGCGPPNFCPNCGVRLSGYQ